MWETYPASFRLELAADVVRNRDHDVERGGEELIEDALCEVLDPPILTVDVHLQGVGKLVNPLALFATPVFVVVGALMSVCILCARTASAVEVPPRDVSSPGVAWRPQLAGCQAHVPVFGP